MIKWIKRLVCKHEYKAVKIAEKQVDEKVKAIGTRFECLKCGRRTYKVSFVEEVNIK